jgi:rhodanese-related sulfurtransferase
MAIRQLTPTAAQTALAADPAAVYLDVRTAGEYDAGHPAGARHIAVMEIDPASGRPAPNADFVAIVGRHFPPATTLIVGCQSGMRSQRACEMLAAAGWTDLANMQGGFGGSPDTPGWRESGLPVETGSGGRLD